MRAAGPLPVATPLEAAGYLQDRRAALDALLRDIDLKAGGDRLTDVRLNGGVLKITPHEAATPEEADRLADRIYALLPRIRITDLLDEVAGWTGAAACFTHLRTGQPADDRRVILTAVLRRQATAELNKGESRNALARAVCFHRLGRIHDRTPESRQHRAGGLNLVVAAIILWNTVYMQRAITVLRARGEIIDDSLLGFLAPLG